MPRLVVPREIQAVIRKMHPDLKRKGKASLKMILSDPPSGKELMGERSPFRSFRVGPFRIIHRIENPEQVKLVAIGPRARIYEETFRLVRKKKGAKEK